MEVHHPHLPHGTKRFKEYFLEFLMIFLAVSLGFFAESLREHLSDNKREEEYIHSLISDLQRDTANIHLITRFLFKNIRGQDSLISLLQHYQDNDSLNRKCYYYYITATCNLPQVTFSERTISQLLNTGNMRLITKKGISDSIMNYNALVKGVNVQGQYYNEQFKKTFDYSINLFDFAYARTPLQEDYKFKILNDFKTSSFKLVSTDEAIRKRYISHVVMLQTIIGTYLVDLKFAAGYETRFIALLKDKYGE